MVMDFGLATTSNADEQTATGMIHGTPRYVAPRSSLVRSAARSRMSTRPARYCTKW